MSPSSSARILFLTLIFCVNGCDRSTNDLGEQVRSHQNLVDGTVTEAEATAQSPSTSPDIQPTPASADSTSADSTPPDISAESGIAGLDLDDLNSVEPSPTDKKAALLAERKELDTKVWKDEVLAQEYEQTFVQIWDELLAQNNLPNGDKFRVLNNIAFEKIRIALPAPSKLIEFGVLQTPLNQDARWLPAHDARKLLKAIKSTDIQLIQTEFHHTKFEPDEGKGATSDVAATFYFEGTDIPRRTMLRGTFHVLWQPYQADGLQQIKEIDATDFELLSRDGAPPFEEILTINHATPATRAGVQPILVRDLNNDGLSEIVLAGANEIAWNEDNLEFQIEPLCNAMEPIFEAGLLADLTGDGNIDLVVPGQRGDLLLYKGNDKGQFNDPPIGKVRGGGPLRQPQVITAGDVDLDGDLDLWVAQYRISYRGGQMPTPYYDANDGFPAFLLLNDGTGKLKPATEEAGLAAKRFRRTYGSSFLDIDNDNDLDLVVVSDFSGVDIYENDGTGYFTDVTENAIDERHLFGMSATFADYNSDGKLDFFVSGMASTTARRLEFMRLGRSDQPQVHMMRSRMGYGNRMYVSQGEGRFEEPKFRDQVARTGWTWGATSLDFDNDGDQDIFVANGHSSGKSTKDHCTHFWCHDIYHNDSKPNPAASMVFQEVLSGYQDRSESWDGYQKNAFLLNTRGNQFTNVGFLLGVGHEYDGRAVISDDLNNDGQMDLIVVEDRWSDGQILHVYRNNAGTNNNWIGVRLRESAKGPSPFGATITVESEAGTQVGVIVTGDSIHAQHSARKHFGLGAIDAITSVTVQWPGGQKSTIEEPAIGKYHDIVPAE